MGRLLRTSLTPPACSVTTVPDTLPSSPILHMLMLLSHLPGAAHTRGQLLTALSSCSCQLCWRAGTARAQGEADLVWGIWGKWPLSCVLCPVLCPMSCPVCCVLCPVPSQTQGLSQLLPGEPRVRSQRVQKGSVLPAGALPSCSRPGRGGNPPQRDATHPEVGLPPVLPTQHTHGDM